MKIDLTNLITNVISVININEEINIDDEKLKSSNIIKLNNTTFNGKIYNDYDNNLVIEGNIKGTMVLPDDITLEEVNYEFDSNIYDYLTEIFNPLTNNIDILDYLWQNILVEVPLKVRSKDSNNIHLEGDGWKLITEEELKNHTNTPFENLSEMLKKGGN